MKIGFLIEYFYPIYGGAENNCYYLARELAKKHDVHVYTSLIKGTKKYEGIDNIKIHRYKPLFRYRYYISLTPGLLKAVINAKIDILHVHSLGFLYHDFIVLLKKLGGTKIVNTPHGPFMALNSYSKKLQIIKKIIEKLEKPINNLYDNIIQVNPYQYKWMTILGIKKSKIKFIPNGINENAFEKINVNLKFKKKLENKKIVSYIGRIDRYKGLDQVIKILPKFKDLIFIIIGSDAGDKERLVSLSRKLKVDKQIIFTGKISEKKKLSILDISDSFVMPSEWEAFSIVILEAMARGIPVISTKTEGGMFLIKDYKNGFLYDFNNIKALEEKISVILKNKDLREKMSSNNMKKAKSFLWRNIAKDLEKLYYSLINSK